MCCNKNDFSFVCEDGDSLDNFMEYNSCILLSIIGKSTCVCSSGNLVEGCEEEIKTLERKEKRKGIMLESPEIVVNGNDETRTSHEDSCFLKTGKYPEELTIKSSDRTAKNNDGVKKFLKRVFSFSK